MMNERRSFLKRTGVVLLGVAGVSAFVPHTGEGSQQQTQPAMIIDLNRCMGCHSCVIACKEQNLTPHGYFNTRIEIGEHGTFPDAWQTYTPELCHHCKDAPCIEACRYEATFSLKSGIVVTDWSRCRGDGACAEACPYNARFLDTQHGNKADKCDFCVTRLQQGLEPACVESCPSRARIFGDLGNPQGEFANYLARVQKDDANTGKMGDERLAYIGLRKS